MKRKILSYVLIVLGLGIMAYPFVSKWIFNYRNEKLLSEYEELYALEEEAEADTESEFESLDEIFGEAGSQEALGDELVDISLYEEALRQNSTTEVQAPKEEKPVQKLPIIGRIKIPKINVKMAILEDASEYHLNLGAARIKGTSKFGTIGNVGIAGHRGRSYGLMFNRLNELKIGDEIEILSAGKTYVYEVYKTHLVLPSDVTVLYKSKEHAVLTLVTCDPVVNPTHRLIVHAVLKK